MIIIFGILQTEIKNTKMKYKKGKRSFTSQKKNKRQTEKKNKRRVPGSGCGPKEVNSKKLKDKAP